MILHYIYALVIARFQYGQYFPSFSYFTDLFHEPLSEYLYEKQGKYWPYCAR